ncbi:hypothetical protein QFC20_000004 [Naganishia adeliensis]|uniref:Uncharacterized protein n=1 Tax=Naganishia adeliensis TaxID=92952 RepID=A0ACC2X247_9TREE|nr:hypothetical protein QFC20_000004 [Naganishia adeliensis]
MRHSEPDAYNVLWSARVTAVGGAILATPVMLFGILLEYAIQGSNKAELKAWVSTIGQLAIGAASSAGTAALVCKILILSLGAEKVKQGVKESAIAGGVGAAVWVGAGLALAIFLSIVMCGCGGVHFLWAWRTERDAVAVHGSAADALPMERI